MLTIKKLTGTFCQSEPDICSRMNNLSGWKRNLKKFKLDQESNPVLCDGWMLRSIHHKGEGLIPGQTWLFLGSFFLLRLFIPLRRSCSLSYFQNMIYFIQFRNILGRTAYFFFFYFCWMKTSYKHSFSSLGHKWWKLWCGCDSLWWKW